MSVTQSVIVVIVLFLSLLLRLHNYDKYPQRGATSDEYTYSFLGISLIKDRMPTSWSFFSDYKNKYDLTINKIYFPMVYPYFDHPPLNGLLVGSWSILFGQDSFLTVDLKTIRLIPIILSAISSFLVFVLAYRLYGYKTGLWALLIYGTAVIFVVGSRVVLAENLLTPLFLLAVFLFHEYKNKLDGVKTIFLGMLAGLAFLTKELGVAVFLTLFCLFINFRIKRGYILTLGMVFFSFIALYLLYGAHYDWNLFKKIISAQANRDIGPKTFYYILSTPIIVNKIYFDGWYFLGFLSLFTIFREPKKHIFIIAPSLIYFLLLLFFLTQKGEMGWYLMPLFPFMAISSAKLIIESLDNFNWLIYPFLLFIGFYMITHLFMPLFGLTPVQYRLMMAVIFLPFAISHLLDNSKLFAGFGNLWFYASITGNIVLTIAYRHPA